jgi:hypothetical protein
MKNKEALLVSGKEVVLEVNSYKLRAYVYSQEQLVMLAVVA